MPNPIRATFAHASIKSISVLAAFRRAKQRDYHRGRYGRERKQTDYASETQHDLVFDPCRARAEQGQAHRSHYQFHYLHVTLGCLFNVY
jgi:hypothetical protein